MMGTVRSLFPLIAPMMVAWFLVSCANQVPPPGGPVDKIPPTIISTYPLPNTLHFNDKRFDLAFDKYVDHRSFEQSIFISPYIADLEFDWSGKDVEVTFHSDLRKNTTYVVNIGTDVVDLRSPANRMAQSFTFAFSTGSDIDHGGIRGKIFPMKPTDSPDGVMIFAYQLAKLDPDTLNPRTLKPDYMTQTGKNGEFYLQHIALGPYRILAVRDEYHNLVYDPEVDQFGVPPGDVLLTAADTLQDNVLMQMAKEDTTAPQLVKVDASDRHHLTIEFSEDMDTSSSRAVSVSVTDTLTKSQLRVFSVFPKLPSRSTFVATTSTQDSTKGYLFVVDSARDISGMPIARSANSLKFTGSRDSDTLITKLSTISIKDSAAGVVLKPKIQFQFSDAVERGTLSSVIVLRNSAEYEVPSSLFWLNDAACVLESNRELSGKSWYTLSVVTVDALDWAGRKFSDSASVVHFETLDAEALSSIEGTVVDTNQAEQRAPILVTADAVDPKNPKTYSTVAEPNGNFFIGEIEEGRYVLHAYRDRNLNGKFDAGRPIPFVGSERFNYAPDTLKLRARWPLEGVRIELR